MPRYEPLDFQYARVVTCDAAHAAWPSFERVATEGAVVRPGVPTSSRPRPRAVLGPLTRPAPQLSIGNDSGRFATCAAAFPEGPGLLLGCSDGSLIVHVISQTHSYVYFVAPRAHHGAVLYVGVVDADVTTGRPLRIVSIGYDGCVHCWGAPWHPTSAVHATASAVTTASSATESPSAGKNGSDDAVGALPTGTTATSVRSDSVQLLHTVLLTGEPTQAPGAHLEDVLPVDSTVARVSPTASAVALSPHVFSHACASAPATLLALATCGRGDEGAETVGYMPHAYVIEMHDDGRVALRAVRMPSVRRRGAEGEEGGAGARGEQALHAQAARGEDAGDAHTRVSTAFALEGGAEDAHPSVSQQQHTRQRLQPTATAFAHVPGLESRAFTLVISAGAAEVATTPRWPLLLVGTSAACLVACARTADGWTPCAVLPLPTCGARAAAPMHTTVRKRDGTVAVAVDEAGAGSHAVVELAVHGDIVSAVCADGCAFVFRLRVAATEDGRARIAATKLGSLSLPLRSPIRRVSVAMDSPFIRFAVVERVTRAGAHMWEMDTHTGTCAAFPVMLDPATGVTPMTVAGVVKSSATLSSQPSVSVLSWVSPRCIAVACRTGEVHVFAAVMPRSWHVFAPFLDADDELLANSGTLRTAAGGRTRRRRPANPAPADVAGQDDDHGSSDGDSALDLSTTQRKRPALDAALLSGVAAGVPPAAVTTFAHPSGVLLPHDASHAVHCDFVHAALARPEARRVSPSAMIREDGADTDARRARHRQLHKRIEDAVVAVTEVTKRSLPIYWLSTGQ